MSKRKKFRIPDLRGVGDGPIGHLKDKTVLREIAKALCELRSGTSAQDLELETQVVEKLFKQRGELTHKPDDLCRYGARLVISAMLAQLLWCKQLARLTEGDAP